MPKSNNRNKARVRVARVHEHIANIRKDFLHKLSTRLVNENQVIAVENLKIKNMMRIITLLKRLQT
jgi:transposase, IS605 OrfB family, central region